MTTVEAGEDRSRLGVQRSGCFESAGDCLILPVKELPFERALLVVGARILEALCHPVTVSELWDHLCERGRAGSGTPVSYATFVLGLDLLYIFGVVDLRGGVLVRTGSSPQRQTASQPRRVARADSRAPTGTPSQPCGARQRKRQPPIRRALATTGSTSPVYGQRRALALASPPSVRGRLAPSLVKPRIDSRTLVRPRRLTETEKDPEGRCGSRA